MPSPKMPVTVFRVQKKFHPDIFLTFLLLIICIMLKKELLDILACPKCKGDVEYKENVLVCGKCRLKYGILEGDIPNMLIEEAEKF